MMKKYAIRLVAWFVFSILCGFSCALAGSRPAQGRIEGVVRDATNSLMPAARVSLLASPQITLATTATDENGRFRFEAVLPGSYVVRVDRPGFSSQRRPAKITANETAAIDFVLEISPIAEQLTVTAETGWAELSSVTPQQVNVISDNSIRMRAPAVLAQIAAEESGLSLQRTSPTIGAVLVRGLTEVGVYVDGVRYTNSTQRGGINTFFNLNEPTGLQAVEVLRGPNTVQYGSDSLGGLVHLISRQPDFSSAGLKTSGEWNSFYNSSDNSLGGAAIVSFASSRFGMLINAAGRRINTLRPGNGIDGHAAVTRFLGLPSDILGKRLPDTAFGQYSGSVHTTYSPTPGQRFNLRYQRGQQDGGKRYDQLLGGDGNLVADLRNLMLDFGYLRYSRQKFGPFDNLSAAVSYNSQREERVNQGGQGNPLASITHDRERTSSFGFDFHLDKLWPRGNSMLIGGDLYRDRVYASSYSLDPASGAVDAARPRVPHGARYTLAGFYLQDALTTLHGRLRLSGALRYNVASYRSRSANSPIVNGRPLFPNDSLRVSDASGRIGAVATLTDGLNIAFNFSRGFRAPNITSLGSLGLVGVGFQVSAADIEGMGATIGTTADAGAASTGIPVQSLKSEISKNYDLSLRLQRRRFRSAIAGFIIDYGDAIVRQTLILPPGATGKYLGPNLIESQNQNGAVFVALSSSPVLVQANYGSTRLKGIEFSIHADLSSSWRLGGNYSRVRAEDKKTGQPPNLGGGGMPPQTGFLSLHYQPAGKRFWAEAYSTLAGRQDRLSSLDLSDRRTGATRSRSNIQNFFRRGATVRGLVGPGPDGVPGNADDRLLATGETLAEVQARVLGAELSAPLFSAIPGYAIFGLRGGRQFGEKQEITMDFSNIADKSHRAPGWGIDGPGRSLRIHYRIHF